MEGTSLVRFMNDKGADDERGQYHWARAGVDGAPFRGHGAPMLREEEYEQKVTKVGDPKVEILDMADKAQKTKYQDILAKVVNGWAQVLHIDRQADKEKTGNWFVYIEYVLYFMEDGSPEAAQVRRTEPTNGRTDEQHMPQPGLLPGQGGGI